MDPYNRRSLVSQADLAAALGAQLSNSIPLASTAGGAAGTSQAVARGDHAHAYPTLRSRVCVFSAYPNLQTVKDTAANFIYANGILIPGGLMGSHSALILRITCGGVTNNANVKLLNYCISSSSSPAVGNIMGQGSLANGVSSAFEFVLLNAGSLSSQLSIYRSGGSSTGVDMPTGAVNTAANWYLHPYTQKATGTDEIYIKSVQVFVEG